MAESGRTEQIITQFLLKALHIVLDSRIPHLCPPHNRIRSAPAGPKKKERWFNLALGELPASLESLQFWHRSIVDPMIVDIILCPRGEGSSYGSVVVERWTVQYESSSSPSSRAIPQPVTSTSGSSSEASISAYRRTYKKSMVLLRSLYSLVRLLPAYKAFRMLNSSTQNYNFDVSYKVSSFAEPFSRAEEDEMMKPDILNSVETQFGHLSVSVIYRPDLSDFNLEVSSLLAPRIISDYVGSPAADPMRAFRSSPSEKDIQAISFPLWGVRSGSAPFTRPHSWTTTPLDHNPLSVSPPMVSELYGSPPDVFGHRTTNHLRQSPHRKGRTSFDEYQLSPPFSPSPTPSPPMHSNSPLRSRMQTETSPVNIPMPVPGRNLTYRTPNFSDPTRNSLPPPSPRNPRMDLLSHESPSESKSLRKLEGLKAGENYQILLGQTFQKAFRDGKDDSGRFSGVLSSGGSPRVFSRSSSRLSFQDDLDGCEFPFAVDDVDTSDSQTRNLDGKDPLDSAQAFMSSRKSHDTAVGILVHMLRTAPPLRQDHSCSSQSSKSEIDAGAGSSSFFVSRKTSDALEELRIYKEMKDMLLSQSGTQLLGSTKQKGQSSFNG